MGERWIRLDADLDDHPDLIDAPWCALDVFSVVLRIVKDKARAGRVESKWTSTPYLCKRLRWPADRFGDEVADAFNALVAIGWLDQDATHTLVPKWSEYQIDPRPSAGERAPQTRITPSVNPGVDREHPVAPRERLGMTGTGTGTGTGTKEGVSVPSEPHPGKPGKCGPDVAAVWNHYRTHHPRCAATLSSDQKEHRLVAAALKRGHTIESLCTSIDGYHRSPFHNGVNETGLKHLGLDLILRDEAHITKGIEMATDPMLDRGLSEKERRGVSAGQAWLAHTMPQEEPRD